MVKLCNYAKLEVNWYSIYLLGSNYTCIDYVKKKKTGIFVIFIGVLNTMLYIKNQIKPAWFHA